MGASGTWRFTFVTVALLLDPTFADILVQPGYGQPGKAASDIAGQRQSSKNQPIVQPQQQYSGPQDQLQYLQQHHALQRQMLQQQHQQQHQQLLGIQHQELQHAAMNSAPGNEVVGSAWGMPSLLPGPLGGSLFSLGPLGLNSLLLGGLGGRRYPLLMATHQQPQSVTESTKSKNSVDEPQTRARRDVRDSGDSKRYRPKQSRSQQDGVANPAVKSKSEASPQTAKSSKSNAEDIVGNIHQEDDNETVGSPGGGLLDPLGLMDKAETLIDNLRNGQLPNPMDMLPNGGGFLPGFPSWLNAANPAANSNGNQPMLGQSQQYSQYPMQGQSNNQYNMMNQQRSQYQQSSGPFIGNARQMPYPQLSPYGAYASPYTPMEPWVRHSDLMSNQRSPMIGAANPAAQDPAGKMSVGNSNGYQQQMTGSQNPMFPGSATQMVGDTAAQPATENAGASGKSSSMNTMNGPVVGAPNLAVGAPSPAQLQAFPQWSYSTGYYPMMVAPNPMAGYYQFARTAQPAMGMQMNPMTGSPGPAAMKAAATPANDRMVGGPNPMGDLSMKEEFNDPNLQRSFHGNNGPFGGNGFNGDLQKHHHSNLDIDGIFDQGYGHNGGFHSGGFNSGGFDRIYETTYHDQRPYGFGGGHPHHTHHHQSYIL